MGIPLMIQEADNIKIEHLKKDLGIHKKIDVIRAGLILLEKEAAQLKKIKRWKQAVKSIGKSSEEINKDFQKYTRLKRDEK